MYNNIRTKLNKFATGGKIPKFQTPATPIFSDPDQLSEYEYLIKSGYTPQDAKKLIARDANLDVMLFEKNAKDYSEANKDTGVAAPGTDSTEMTIDQQQAHAKQTSTEANKEPGTLQMVGGANMGALSLNMVNTVLNWDTLKKNGQLGQAFGGMAAQAGVMVANAVDQMAMGDKNFGALSAAIDSAVHGASKALMSSGNVYAMAAGAALEGANFLTKAGGQTVQGFDVDINNSGYGNLGHMESSSSRDFGAMIGLGGLNRGKMQDKLAKRNEQARMALTAAAISEDQSFEQEARMNSIENTIMNNLIALDGGLETSMLAG